MTDDRLQKIRQVAANRQSGITIVLDNVYDPHNIGAVIRSAEAVGLLEVYVLHTDPEIAPDKIYLGRNASGRTKRWIDIRYFRDTQRCFDEVKSRYQTILGTHLGVQSTSLYSLDLTQSVALVFGSEHSGISPDTLPHLDGNFIIPQMGFTQSLNISVACAVTLFEALRQRDAAGMYSHSPSRTQEEIEALTERYIARARDSHFNIIEP